MAIKWADVEVTDKYKTATPELKLQIQDKFFDTQVKTSPGYKPGWEKQIKSRLFAPKAKDKGIIDAIGYSMAEAVTRIPRQLAEGFQEMFPQPDIVAERKSRLEKRRSSLLPEQIAKEEQNIIRVENYLKAETKQKEQLDKEIAFTKAKHPIASFVGGAAGGVYTSVAATATGLPLWASFGGLGLLEEASRQFATPEEKLNPVQRAAKISVSGAAGAVTGAIWKVANIGKTFLSRALRRSAGAGVTTITESIVDEFASGKQPDVNAALLRGGTNAVSIAVLSYLTELPELRGLVWREAKANVGKPKMSTKAKLGEVYKEPKTYEEAKQIVKEVTSDSPEALSPQFKKAKQDFVREGIKRDTQKNIDFYKKNLGLNENEISDLFRLQKVEQVNAYIFNILESKAKLKPQFWWGTAENTSQITHTIDTSTLPENTKILLKTLLATRNDIASGLVSPEEIAMSLELRAMAKPKTVAEEVVKTEKPTTPAQEIKPAEQAREQLKTQPAKPIEPVVTPQQEAPGIQPVPIQLPKELTEGEHIITPEQALDKTVAEVEESQYVQNDIFETTIRKPIETQMSALKEQLKGLKGQKGGEPALARKDINSRLEALQGQLNQAENAIQEQYMDWGMQLQDIIKTKAEEQGLNLEEEDMQNLADEVTMAITEPWGRERYWNNKVSEVIDDVIDEWKKETSPEVAAKETEIKAKRMAEVKEDGIEKITDAIDKDLKERQSEAKLLGQAKKETPLESKADKNYKLAGYYDISGSTEKDEHESGNLAPERKFKKDLIKFSKALADELGWEHDIENKKIRYANTNIASIGGDGSIVLWKPNSEYGIYIFISTQRVNGDDLEIGGLVDDIMYRATTKKDKYTGKGNNFTNKDVTVGKMAELARKEIAFYEEPAIEQKPLPKAEKSDILKVKEKEATEDVQTSAGEISKRPDIVGGGERPSEQVQGGEVERQQQSLQSEVKQQRSAQHNQESNAESRQANLGNYRITRADQIGAGSPKEKYRNNILAIQLLKKLEQENRKATPEEQAALVKYAGWGGLSKVFESSYGKGGWEREYKELKELLTDEEYSAARASTINAHYTSQEVIQAMWQAVTAMGFERGKVLEPAMGIGHFIGLRPEAARIAFTGIELDNLTGRIAKQLYQNGDVQIKGFEEALLSRNFYDLAISNVPFADIKPFDPKAKELGIPPGLNLHDYFFAKSLALVKPGGVVAFITSKGTMDKIDPKLREHLSKSADLLGAIRLPRTAFKATAGTEVTTDIIFLRKRLPNEQPAGENWTSSTATKISNRNINVNEYFLKNTAMVLGNMKVGRGLYSDNELSVEPLEEPLADSLKKAIDFLPKNVIRKQADIVEAQRPEERITDEANVNQGSFVIKDDKVYQKEDDKLVEQRLNDSDKARLISIIHIRDALKELYIKQEKSDNDNDFKREQERLNSLYDRFVKRYGSLSNDKNEDLFIEDPARARLMSLEVEDKKNKKFVKNSDIFTKRVIHHHRRPSQADSAKDAAYASLSEYGHLNWNYMSEITGKAEEELQKELSAANLIYKNPEGEKWELRDEYLAGNVKLKIAEAATKLEPAYEKNISALKEVIPADKTFQEITARIGTPWIEPKDHKDFISELLEISAYSISVEFNPIDSLWAMNLTRFSSANTEEYGTNRYPAIKLLEAIANNKQIKVLDKVTIDGEEKSVINEEETAVAQDKADILKQKFQDWFWQDEERRDKYLKLFNDEFNAIINRYYDGSHLTLPGMSPIYAPRKTQLDAIYRGIVSLNLLLAHEVGAGKTLIMIAIIMESKRLGLIKKPLVIVPRNTLSQWKRQFNIIYPASNVLIADEKNFTKAKRQMFLGRAASGNWDAIIMADSSNFLVEVSEELRRDYISEQLDELRAEKERQRDVGNKITIKQIEKAILQREARLKETLDVSKKDKGIIFEELGVDSIFVDEADRFKNLAYNTKMQGVKGLGAISGNDRTEDLMMKLRVIRKRGGKVVFATGTPISNSMAEVHVMMKYLQPDLLEEKGLKHFDGWAKAFGELSTDWEVDASRRYKAVTRFSKFVNLQSLLTMLRETWDIQTAEMLEEAGILVKGENLPFYKGGKPTLALLQPSGELKEYIQELAIRADAIKGKRAEKGGDNMLVILMDGIMASTDMRMIDPALPAHPDSKIEYAISGIFERWEKNKDFKATQIVFIDRTKPDEKAAFNPHWYMKRRLIEMGIPEKEIAFIHDHDSIDEKDDLYAKVNSGEIRVLFGSTEKLGAGTNVQERLMTLWHIDTPYRPRDIIQREGRIMRPGNLNKEVEVIRLATIGSFDTFLWQLLEVKAKYISDVMSGKVKTDVMDEAYDEYAIIKAATSDDPLLKEKVGLDKEVKRLTHLKNAFLNEKFKSQKALKEIPKEIEALQKRIETVKEDITKRPAKLTKENFKIEIGGNEYTTKEDGWTALKKAFDSVRMDDWNREIPVGKYQGFNLSLYIRQDPSNTQKQNMLMIKGAVNYEAIFSESAIGTFASMDNALYSTPDKVLENITIRHDEANKHLIISKAIAEKDFEYQKALDEKTRRQIEVNRLLKEATEGKKADDSDDIIEMHAGIPIGQAKEEPVDDKLNTDPAGFIDSEVERRFNEAYGQQHPNALAHKIKQSLASLWESLKVFPGLPATEYYAEAKFILGLQKHAITVARDKTIRNLNYITHKFGVKKLKLFTRAVILADFTQEAAKGRPIPLGYSYYDDDGNVVINTELLARDKANIDAIIELNPDIKEALERRKATVEQVANDLVKYKILTKDQLKEDYYRHQVLEYANAKATYTTGKKLKTPRPGYGRRRYGTVDKDINTNYLEAEFEFMSQALYDIETAKNIDRFRASKYNIKDSLKEQARQHNDQMLDRVTIEGQYNDAGDPATLRDLLKPFNQKMGWGFSILEELGYAFPKDQLGTFETLADIAESETAEARAQMAARMILKAVSDRKAFIKQNLGKNYKEWSDIIPEGYTTWQPREGRMFYNAFSVPQRIINEVMNKAGEDAGINQNDLKKLLAVGGLREEFVIPQELSDTLNQLYTIKLPNWLNDITKAITSIWKKQAIFHPRRVLSYNYQNFLGDADHAIAANPRILKYFWRAANELGDMFYRGKLMTREMREFFERGGISTMLTIQEIPEIKTLDIFLRMNREAENSFSLENAKIGMKKAWNTVIRFTMFRESILRYAAYLHYRDVFVSGGAEYGGARREDVMGLSDPLDKAAKVANDTMGDYSNISQLMTDMRQTLIPFGSWPEINFKIYYNLNRNAWIEGGVGKGTGTAGRIVAGAGVRVATFAGMTYYAFFLKMVLITSIMALWNHLFHGDEEKDLNPYDQNRGHIVIGRDKNGDVKIRRGQGAFADLLEWGGLDQLNVLLRDYWEGKASLVDIFGKIPFVTGKVGLKPAYLKIVRGINPVYKAVAETLTGKYLPGLDERSGVIEDKARNILKSWNLENEYDWLTKKPTRGYAQSWEQAFITTTDPEENAFRYIQGQKHAFRERLGKGGSGDYYTPRSIVYRQYKKALAYKDEGARINAVKEMMKLGVQMEDLERSLKTNEPLHGLNEEEKEKFVKEFLSQRDREKLRTAYKYYIKTFLKTK